MSHSHLKCICRSALRPMFLLAASALVFGKVLKAQSPRPPTPVPVMPSTRSANNARPISLDEAIRLAQRVSPAAIQAKGVERADRAAVRAAYGAMIPNLTATAGRVIQYGSATTRINANGEQVAIAQKPTNSTGLNFNLQLFDGGQRLFDLRAARANVEAAGVSRLGAEYAIALDVKRQYYAVLAAIESEDAADAQIQQANEQFKSSVAKVNAGVATRSDSLRGVVLVNNARLALITAEASLSTANAALTRLVGSDTPVTADPASVIDRPAALPDSAALIALAEEGPAVREARANLDAARQVKRASKTTYLPTLNASYSRNGSGVDSRFGLGNDPFTYNGRLSFSASYPIFNGWQREAAVVRADVAEDNAKAALRDAQLAASASLAGYIGTLRAAAQRVEVQQASVAAAEEDLRVQQQRYNIGASTLLDLLTSQTTLQQARSALIAARYDYRIARAQIESLIGRDLE